MGKYSINTHEYDIDLKRLIERRLKQVSSKLEVKNEDKYTVYAFIETQKELEKWCSALSRVLLHDIAPFELAKTVDDIELELEEKEEVLTQAVKFAKNVLGYNAIRKKLHEYFEDSDSLNLEGFVLFRMDDTKAEWDGCVDEALREFAVRNEYLELMSVWASFARMSPSRMEQVNVILHPDGSCTLTDETDSRIDCSKCTFDGIVSLLVGLAPEHITVYDMSAGENKGMAEMLLRVFEDKIRFLK